MRLVDADSGEVVVERLEVADSFVSRFFGLMGRRGLEPGAGLLLEGTNSVHMFFMRFAIDVVFLDRDGRVKRLVSNLRPWRLSPIVFGAARAVEAAANSIDPGLVGRTLRVE
jgi:uncharacterized membrane protein (UPF0127 family)